MIRALVLITTLLLVASCATDDGALTLQEVDDLLEVAAGCSPGDICVAVDTYCCPRAINSTYQSTVEDAMSRLKTDEVCLADCISAAELDAVCIGGRCQIE